MAAQAPILSEMVTELRTCSKQYQALVELINPRYVPGGLEGYDEATDRLEKLGATLETLSRKALQAQDGDPDTLKGIMGDIQQYRESLQDFRAFATPFRAYSYLSQNDVNRPRWAFARVDPDRFIIPDVHAFDGDFIQEITLTGEPGSHVRFQLVAIPIAHDIHAPRVHLPEVLTNEEAAIEHPLITCGQAATRSSPVPDEDREHPDCPYRLRDCSPGHTIQKDRVQPYWFTLKIPADAAPGVYTDELKFTAQKVHDVTMTLCLEIPQPAEE
ncbi:MAG: hypothetical protein ACLFWB_03730 [Armatimonadota bacterium]